MVQEKLSSISMERIAVLNSVCVNSTGKIAVNLNHYLISKGYESVLCYGFGEKVGMDETYCIETEMTHKMHALRARILGDEGCGSIMATKRLIRYLDKRNTKVVYLISLHGYYINRKILFDYLINKNIKVVYIMIDEHAFLGKCGYSDYCMNYLYGCGKCPQLREYPKSFLLDRTKKLYEIKKQAYLKMDMLLVGPEYTIKRAKTSPLLKNKKFVIVDEAVDVDLFYPRDTKKIREQLGISDDKKIIVCVAPYSYKRKGCIYFLELAKRLVDDQTYVFVHVGFDGEKDLCPPNYIAIDFIKDQNKLAEFYSLGDVFVFPSLLDTMPNACLESLACGTPILGFNISGMPYICNEETGTFVEPKSVDALVDKIKDINKKNLKTINVCRQYALSRYDNHEYNKKLLEVLNMFNEKDRE